MTYHLNSLNCAVYPLTLIINLSFGEGKFPTQLKLANIITLLKQGSAKEVGKYCPISLIPTFSKAIEKVVLSRHIYHLFKHDLLTNIRMDT